MALIQLSSNIDNIKGSIGHITYSKGRSGIIEKNKSHPGSVHPFTPSQKQLDLRQSIRTLSPMWKGLQESQRIAWNALAKTIKKYNEFGEQYFSSGFNLFIECNHNLQLISCALIMDAPIYTPPRSLISFSLFVVHPSAPVWEFSLLFPNQTTDANTVHLVYATGSLSPGKSYIKNQYRYITTIQPGFADQYDISLKYNAQFPTKTSGDKVFIKLKAIQFPNGFPAPDIFSNSILP